LGLLALKNEAEIYDAERCNAERCSAARDEMNMRMNIKINVSTPTEISNKLKAS
jgi:hypothetical protein